MKGPLGPLEIDIPPVGVDLLRQAQVAEQRFNDWTSGFLAGTGHSANYTVQSTPAGLKLVRVDGNEPTED